MVLLEAMACGVPILASANTAAPDLLEIAPGGFSIPAEDSEALTRYLPRLRRVITHDTAKVNVTRSAGLSIGKRTLYVQTIDQKLQAQLAGLGIGHLPRHRIQRYLDSGELRLLNMPRSENDNFIAWKLAHKGKALQTLSQQLIQANWQRYD